MDFLRPDYITILNETDVFKRQGCERTFITSNADMDPVQIRKYCRLDDACQALMKIAMHQLQLIARAYHRVLKLSPTIGD
jgi:magnesium chelatase family protein